MVGVSDDKSEESEVGSGESGVAVGSGESGVAGESEVVDSEDSMGDVVSESSEVLASVESEVVDSLVSEVWEDKLIELEVGTSYIMLSRSGVMFFETSC